MKASTTPKLKKQMSETLVESAKRFPIFKPIITLLASAIVASHLVICLIIMINPSVKIFNRKSFTDLYKRYALPGPYFREDLITSSPHFYIAGKKGRLWEEWRNPELENFNTFHKQYWHYDKLKQGDLERHLANDFRRRLKKDGEENFTNYREFKALHHYFSGEYFKEKPDSIRMLYTHSIYKPRERKTVIDTVFFLKYKPW